MLLGIEIRKIPQKESARVADAPIRFGKTLQYFRGDPDVVAIVFG